MDANDQTHDIAIVGMSCRVPGAHDTAAYWSNLCGGVESITVFSEDELMARGVSLERLRDPGYVRAFGAMPDPYAFDAAFFRINPSEAQVMDPQQRVFLECAWTALEDAGCDPDRFAGAVGVFAGCGFNAHYARVLAHPELIAVVGEDVARVANNRDFLTTRVSYKFGLRGPSLLVQTACSTSLVAIHLACQSLLNRECDLALAGGVSIAAEEVQGYQYQEGGIRSRDGHCRAFDAAASGTVVASGAGVVVLKRLGDALRDGDAVRAIVKGSAVNNDGSEKIGFTAPSVKGQAHVIAEALAVADLTPSEVSYIETHGTGTPLGDPIEIAALKEVFATVADRRIALGAVKTNIGHLDAAAGVAGFIKTVLALQHRMLPPTLHFETPNPETGLEASPFHVNATLQPWDVDGVPRRAGVSSFGLGGTNAHVVLEEAPAHPSRPLNDTAQLIVLSAKSESALSRMRQQLAAHIAAHPDIRLADVAFTLQEGRAPHAYRWAAVARDLDAARAALAGTGSRPSVTRRAPDQPASVAFLFPGQGSQHAGMARALYASEPGVRADIDGCLAALPARVGSDVRSALFPTDDMDAEATARLQQTYYTQLALFTVEYALARFWMSRGIQPDAMLGHSIGDYVAACLAGVFTPERALRLVEARGRLMQGLPGGAMLAVQLSEQEITALMSPRLSLAAVNGADQCVVSGDAHDVDQLWTTLMSRGVSVSKLHTSHAFHSAAMDPILHAFEEEVRRACPAAPSLPLLSNVTGDWMTASDATDPAHWVRHLRGTVRFADSVSRLLERPDRVLLEVGPGDTLAMLARAAAGGDTSRVVVKSLPRAQRPDASDVTVLEALGALWAAGVPVDWALWRGDVAPRRVPLPTYPFERTEYRVPSVRPFASDGGAHAPVVASQPLSQTAEAAETTRTRALDSSRLPGGGSPVPAAMPTDAIAPRRDRIAARLVDLFARLLGTTRGALDVSRAFVEQGADSLLLMQASRSIEAELGLRLPFRRLLDGCSTITALAAHLDRELPPEDLDPHGLPVDARAATVPAPRATAAVPAPHVTPAAPPARTSAPTPDRLDPDDASGLRAIAQQLAVMQAQLDALCNRTGSAPAIVASRDVNDAAPLAHPADGRAERTSLGAADDSLDALASHGPHRPIRQTIGQGVGYTDRQAKHVEALVRRYTALTPRSKAYAADYRPVLADNRAALGFRMATKELVYPVVGERSEGSRLWDLDGNEYIDFTMGFGVHFFGHRPPFIVEAVEAQLRRGFHLGPQSNLAGPVARLLRELTGMERVTFCNTGSEAVMTALRIARAVTGRARVALFEDSYHGTFDGVLARRRGACGAEPASWPVAAGIPQRMVDDVVVLPYGTREAMEWLTANAGSLAAVLVEPAQSRHLELHPREFLQNLRAVTEQTRTVLIFDEMITGFRLGPRGAQGFYEIDADLATYGKVIGGGFPLGVIAGRARFMDAIDGGMWQFGDDSFPAADQTFFAGTFCKHPVAMAAAFAVLEHIRRQGPSLYDELNARTARLVAALRHVLAEEDVPVRIETCGSRFTFHVDRGEPFAPFLFYHLLELGMYIWEGRGCFLSTAHTDADCDRLVDAFRESLGRLREGGFLPERSGSTPARTFPLTPAQRQVWVHAQLGDDASRAYNEQLAFAVHGRFDVAALCAALQDVMQHHESLRTVFDASGETQHVLPSLPIAFRVETPASEGADYAPKLRDAARETFDIAHGPLVRVHVYPRRQDDHVVQIVYHHIATDGLGFVRVLRDLEAAYEARRDGRAPLLPSGMQLSEYVELLADHAAACADREPAWLRRFEGAAPLVLSTDHPRSSLPTGAAAQARKTLSPAVTAALREFGLREGCTLFMTLLGGMLALLHRFTGQDDIVIGISSAGRTFPGSESLVAHCVDVLPLRSRVDGTETMRGFVMAVRRSLLDAYEDDVFSLARLTEKLRITRGPGLPPLVSVTFNLEPRAAVGEARTTRFADLAREDVGGRELFARFDLHVDAMEVDDRIELLGRYNAELFERDTITRMLEQLARALEQIVAMPELPLADLCLLGDAERRLVVDEWNRTAIEDRVDGRVHQLFEEQARRIPEAVAVVCEERQLTYRQLNARANQLAHYLRRRGVTPDTVVGMYFDRSLDAVVALLGILKAGGAYLPLDPGVPQERLHYMLDAAGAFAVVTRRALAGSMRPDAPRVVLLDDDEPWERESRENPAVVVDAAHLAYVIYTSGSTGQPKGVAIEHRQLTNYVLGVTERLNLLPGASYATVSTLSADLGNTVVFSSLVGGGCLHVIAEPRIFSGEALRRYFDEHPIDALKITPSHLAALQAGSPIMPRRWLVLGGEASRRSWVDALNQLAPTCAIFNHYGPTETTVGVLTWAVTGERQGVDASLLPLGRPLPNTQVYVVDEHLRPIPIGMQGELYIGGAQVARGYLRRPALTAERFLPDPFAGEPGARLYRTGDRVRWRSDGTVEFLGRVDRQVKIRGVRVELEEIEHTLRQHAHVRECAVVVRSEAPGEPRLVAYVVGDASVNALRAHAQRSLPDAMVPSAFVTLDAMPLTSNGKVDHKALPAPEATTDGPHVVTARTPVEEVLLGIWADLLGLEHASVDDNFFKLGGHSLLAMRAVTRIRQTFGIELPVRTFFDAATAAVLAGAIEALRRAGTSTLPPVVPTSRATALPLSFSQERLWFLDRLQPGSIAYNLPAARRISGVLHVPSLERALGEIVRRHEVLRTRIAEVDGAAVQVIRAFDGFALPVDDPGALDEGARDAAIAAHLRRETTRPFDLAAGPLFRPSLLRLAADDHLLVLCTHHLVSDGWSMELLFRELSALYAAYARGGESPLPEMVVQYADYAVWQRTPIVGDLLTRQLAYWRKRLAGAPELIQLPTDRSRPATQTDRGARVLVELPPALHERLQALGRREGVTLYMVLLGAFQILLASYSGSDDVVVGSPLAGRTRKEIEELIGFFVNTLVLRTSLAGDPSIRAVLQRVRQTTLEAYEHQELPFEQLVAALQPQRSMTHSPIFQVMFSLHQMESGGVDWPGLRVQRIVTGEVETTKFDLIFEAFVDSTSAGVHGTTPLARGLRTALTYRTELFERSTIQRMLAHLTRVLEQMAEDPDRRLSEIELLDETESSQIVEEWNATTAEYPAEACLHDLFEAQAERTPGAIAVVCGDERLRYRELNERANRLAHHLQARGVGPDAPVGICLERSFEMVVGLFAILKAGGAYVPLDPASPTDRLRHMVEDSAPVLVLTHAATRTLVAELPVPAIDLEAEASAWSARPATNPDRGALDPDHLCYVIYTSGSTGRPKGVMNQHRCVVNRLVWGQRAFGMAAEEAILGHIALTFDGSLRELFWPLSVGASVVLAARDGARDPDALWQTIRRAQVTTINLVPSTLQLLLEHGDVSSGSGLRRVLCGGEALPSELLQRVHERWPQVELHHLYGPSEAATAMAALRCVPSPATSTVPIGRPTANVRVYVVDTAGRPVPVGVVGELLVAGVGVSRGYLHRPALTAERFVPDPFSDRRGARLYRTGDLARWLPDGTIEFCGRNDFQVKVRGFRVEPSEIEVVLRRHPGIAACVVVARSDASGDPRLIAYYVGDCADAHALRTHVAARLPEYMVPAAYVRLEALPLTPTGKLDRLALPAPDSTAYAARVYDDPRGPVEVALAEIWVEVLGVERVGRTDHFFELGGHSLRAVQVMSRVRQVLAVDVPLREIFLQPVLADFARRLQDAARTELPPIERVDRAEPLALSFAQQRLWFVEQMGGMGAVYHISRRLRLRGELDRESLARALSRIVERHETLRTTFTQVDGEPVQRVAAQDEGFLLRDHDLRHHTDAERELGRLASAEVEAPFDLARGPLIRGRLIQLADDDHVLVITMHHIVSDGWSTGVFVDELGALYAAFRHGDVDPLPPFTIQYADYAMWQRRLLDGERLMHHAAYWQSALAGAPELLALPTDAPRPAQQDFAGDALRVTLDETLTAGLRALSRRHGTTLFMTLLAGWAVVLGRLAGHDDVVIGAPAANRGHREIEGLIGFFVNMLALRVNLSGSPTVSQLLERVKAHVLDVQPHEDMPFEQLVELMRPVRSLAYHPLFQVVFSWQNVPRRRLELPGLTVDLVEAERVTAKYDLSLTLLEKGGRIEGELAYATALFERHTMERHVGFLRKILQGMVADDYQRVPDVAWLDEAERQQVVTTWNQTARPYPREQCIHDLFERQAARTPDAVALVWGRTSLTYGDLDARANQLAHDLTAIGVQPDVRVGLYFERSIELLVSMLAVLKAGACYVPLDPTLPMGRLGFMLTDAAVLAVVTPAHVRDALTLPEGVQVIAIDERCTAINAQRAGTRVGQATPENLACILYTSGSTGRPKGVMVAHRHIVQRVCDGTDCVQMRAGDRIAQVSNPSFDASTFEIWGAWSNGATLVGISNDVLLSPAALHEVLRAERVTTLFHTTALFNQLSREQPDIFAGLRDVIFGGELADAEGARRVLRGDGPRRLVNVYGPTETMCWCSWELVEHVAEGARTISIGRPTRNAAVYVLDKAFHPVPVGVPGEAYVGGAGVVRGYLDRPRLTAERFVPDPFAAEPGARLYCTGDTVRWRADGKLEFVGRRDAQLKISGFRIEPGEIEAMLLAFPEVREARVVAHNHAGEMRLVAYVVGAATVESIRAHLSQELPAYMLPSAIVILDRMPHTPHGKLDTAALPPPDFGAAGTQYVAPRTPLEERLADIWADVLRIDRVGATDHFFELGGHSLLIMRLTAQIRAAFGLDLSIRAVFAGPTLEQMAGEIERRIHDEILAMPEAEAARLAEQNAPA